MSKIIADKETSIFGALKLIEQLYLDDKIPGHVFRNILEEYQNIINITDFECHKEKSDRKE